MRLLTTILALLLSATSLLAQPVGEKSEVVVYYRYDKHSIDHHYLSNPEAFATLDSLFTNYADAIDSISIVAYASPEGRQVYNQWLSGKRAESMKRFLKVKYPAVDFSNLKTYAKGEDWAGLVKMVEKDKNVPYRNEVLKILRNKKLHVDNRMKKLYKLREGTPYRYIRKNILPMLRTATTCIIYYNEEWFANKAVIESLATNPIQMDQVGGGSIVCAPTLKEFTPTRYLWQEEMADLYKNDKNQHIVALKTNLLFDAVGAVNIGAEVPIGNRTSLEASWTFPWYLEREWDWCYQLLWGDLEARWWLGERNRSNRLMGHFVGLYAGGGLYDFQWRSTDGYQGEFFIAAGMSYGYSMKLRSGWNLEFELGVGYLQSDYRHYFHITEPDGTETLIRDKVSGRFGYWGPTKAKVSLVLPIEWKSNKRVRE